MAELDSPEDQDTESGELEYLMSDITHIITCLFKSSIAIRNPAPKERLHKIALIKVSHFEYWDIKYVDEKFCQAHPQNNFRVANYLKKRLGKANTRRRQILKYYEAHHQKISQYIDDSLPSRSVIERNEFNAPNPMASTMGGGSARASTRISDFERATIYTAIKSQTTLPTVKTGRSRAIGIERDEEQLSQTSYAPSTNYTMRIRVPSPPSEQAAFEGEPFECPYCFNIIKIRGRQGWKYVGW